MNFINITRLRNNARIFAFYFFPITTVSVLTVKYALYIYQNRPPFKYYSQYLFAIEVTKSIIGELKNIPDKEFEKLQKNQKELFEKISDKYEEEHGGLMCKMIFHDYGEKLIQCRTENDFKTIMFDVNFDDLSIRYKNRNKELDLGYQWKFHKFLKKIKLVE
eukprot:gene7425-11748_t